MTSYSPRIYTYKITFEEVPYYYYGVHKENKYNEYYMGSPVTHKWRWKFYTPKKQILELFEYSDEGWVEAQKVEKRIIKPIYNNDNWCLNENCGGFYSLDACILGGKVGSDKNKKNKVGIFDRSKEKMIEDGKKGWEVAISVGFNVKGGHQAKELGVGIHGRTKKQKSEDGRKGGKRGGYIIKHLGIGVHGRTKEQMSIDGKKGGDKGGSKGGKKTSLQKWMCLETGFVTNAGCLSRYQKARGIDTSKRKRIE